MVHRPAASQLTPFFDRSKNVTFFYRSISVLLPFRCTYRTTVLTVPLYGTVNVNFFWPLLYVHVLPMNLVGFGGGGGVSTYDLSCNVTLY